MKLSKHTRLIGLLIAISIPGVLIIAFQAPGMVEHLEVELPSASVLISAAIIQSLVLVTSMAALGVWLAPKVHLGAPVLARLVEGRNPRAVLASQAKVALPVGLAVGALMIAAEVLVFRPYLPDSLYLLGTPLTLHYLAAALAYGGIVEEVLLRWGVMSLLVWLIFLLIGRRNLSLALLLGNALAALLFAVGHLPAVILVVGELTTPVLWRTLILNALPGFVFGLFFQRKGLEAAMLAHMGAHLGMAVFRLVFGP